MNLPNFLIIGAARCGTSSLHQNLKAHPKLCYGRLPKADVYRDDPLFEKEMHFFDKEDKFNRGLQWYASRWDHAKPGQLRFESTPNYISHPKCPQRIADVMPNGRFILMLRNPVDRAWSHYWWWKDRRRLSIFDLQNPHIDIIRKGIYYDQVRRWLCQFPLDRFLIIRSEDYFANERNVLRQVFDWIGIEPIDTSIYFDPRRSNRWKKVHIPKPPKHVRKQLWRTYAKYNAMLEDLLERKFEWN